MGRILFKLFIMLSQNTWHHHWCVYDSQTQLIKYSSPLETSHLNCWCLKISFWRQDPLWQDATLVLLLHQQHRACQAKQLTSLHAGLVLAFTYTKNCIMLSLTYTDGKTLFCMYSIHAYSSWAQHILVLSDSFLPTNTSILTQKMFYFS